MRLNDLRNEVGEMWWARWGGTADLDRAVRNKLAEECIELYWALQHGRQDEVEEELGDVLFVVLAVASYRGVFDIESIVESTIAKNRHRWRGASA